MAEIASALPVASSASPKVVDRLVGTTAARKTRFPFSAHTRGGAQRGRSGDALSFAARCVGRNLSSLLVARSTTRPVALGAGPTVRRRLPCFCAPPNWSVA